MLFGGPRRKVSQINRISDLGDNHSAGDSVESLGQRFGTDAELAHPASDLNVEARRWAIGYAGISQVPVGLLANGSGQSITVPAIGLRYWISEAAGLDVGLGIGWTGGSQSTSGTSMDKNDIFGFVLQAGSMRVDASVRGRLEGLRQELIKGR